MDGSIDRVTFSGDVALRKESNAPNAPFAVMLDLPPGNPALYSSLSFFSFYFFVSFLFSSFGILIVSRALDMCAPADAAFFASPTCRSLPVPLPCGQ